MPFCSFEVGLEAVERPAAEGQTQAPVIGQREGDDLGTLSGGIGEGTPGPRPILQAVQPLVIEAMDPGVGRGA